MKISTVLVFVTLALFIGVGGLPVAMAQEVTFQTSAHSHEDIFFGEAVLQVVLIDPNADNDSVEDIQVNIEANSNSGSTSESFLVPETSDSSGKFEFFLVHVDATAVGQEDLDPINIQGVSGDGACVTDCAPFLTFGPGGDLNIQSDLYEQVGFEFTAGNTNAEASYEETPGSIGLDRDSYGTDSFVYISIKDQDANLNPFEKDEFVVDSENPPNDDLLELSGGTLEVPMVFSETGQNTAVFEGKYRLGDSITADSKSLSLTLHEKANYESTLDATENDSNNTDEISFIIGNSNGSVDIGGSQNGTPTGDPILGTDKESYALGENVNVTITDKDANTNSNLVDSIKLNVASGRNHIEIMALETGENSGTFLATFTFANETDAQIAKIAPGSSATISYTDKRPADYLEKIQAGLSADKDFAIDIDVMLPILTGIESTNMSVPVIKSTTGATNGFTVGNSLTLSTWISNNNEVEQPFFVIIEVRDNNDVTVYLALQSGTLQPVGSTDIGASWQPENAGSFVIRTFAITDIRGGAEPLSAPSIAEITVS